MKFTLHYIPFSPWSLKARFALRHHGIEVRGRVYTPLIDELGLRVRLRKLGGRVTVPILFTPHGVLTDSWAIASFADRIGKGASLMPRGKEDLLEKWNAASERLMNSGRARSIVRASRDTE